MVQLLDLPSELFSLVIKEHVNKVGIVEAWGARVVCKTFRAFLSDEVFKNQPLDKFNQRIETSRMLVANLRTFLYHRFDCSDGAVPTRPTTKLNTSIEHPRIHLPAELWDEVAQDQREEHVRCVVSIIFVTSFFTRHLLVHGIRAFDLITFESGPDHSQGLSLAAAAGHVDLAQKYLDQGATPYDFLLRVSHFSSTYTLPPPLVAASITGQTAMVRHLVHHIDRHAAALDTRVVIQALLKESIQAAIRNAHPACFEILARIWTRRSFPIENHENRNILYQAWGKLIGQTGCRQSLHIFLRLAGNAAPKMTEIYRWACRRGHVRFVRHVLNRKGLNLEHALGEAVHGGSRAVVRFLLQNGANINGRSGKQSGPLVLVIKRHQFQMVTFLVENGAKVDSACVAAALGFVSSCDSNVVKIHDEQLLTAIYIGVVTGLPSHSNTSQTLGTCAALEKIEQLVQKTDKWKGLPGKVEEALSRLPAWTIRQAEQVGRQ